MALAFGKSFATQYFTASEPPDHVKISAAHSPTVSFFPVATGFADAPTPADFCTCSSSAFPCAAETLRKDFCACISVMLSPVPPSMM